MNGGDGTHIRNVAVVSSVGVGKTTLVEAILFAAGAIPTMGTVVQGTTVSDFDPDEQHRHHSLADSVLQFDWSGTRLTLIDTPGERSLQGEVLSALRATDAVLFVVSAGRDVRPELGRLWSAAGEQRLPAVLFVTDLDKEGASFDQVLEAYRELLEDTLVLPITIPAGRMPSGEAVVDLLHEHLVVSAPDKPQSTVMPIPAALSSLVDTSRKPLVEAAAETDDALLERYLADGDIPLEAVQEGLAEAVRTRRVIPAYAGSALHHVGIGPLLDGLVHLLPPPGACAGAGWQGIDPVTQAIVAREGVASAPLSALVFKTVIDPFMGHLSLVRLWSGTLSADSPVYNPNHSTREKCGHLFSVLGKKYTPVHALTAGEIGAVAKLKVTQSGDTLCDEHHPILFPPLALPRPVLSVAIDPKSKTDIDKVSIGLHKIVEEDPTLGLTRDDETKELVLSGMGQLHLDVAVDRLRRKYGAEVEVHTPRVPYKETIRQGASAQGKYKKQTGGHGQYGDCWIQLTPLPPGRGFIFGNNVVGGAIPRNFIPAVEKGVIEAMHEGVLAGYPVVDLQATVYDGSSHVVDSSEMAFKIAGSMAFKKAMEQAHPVLLEPLMQVEVTCPDELVGAVIGDLNGRRGRITSVTARGHVEQIQALVPLVELLKYAPALTALTGGRAEYSMGEASYEEVPRELAGKVIEEARAGKGTTATV